MLFRVKGIHGLPLTFFCGSLPVLPFSDFTKYQLAFFSFLIVKVIYSNYRKQLVMVIGLCPEDWPLLLVEIFCYFCLTSDPLSVIESTTKKPGIGG